MAVGDYPIEDFADYLRAQLPDGIHVYGHAADIGKLPAVVLVPGNPSIAVAAQGGPTFTLAWGIDATLVVNRSQPKYGTREIFDLWRQVAEAAVSYTDTVTILTLEEVGEVEWSGGTAIAGTMPLVITVQET